MSDFFLRDDFVIGIGIYGADAIEPGDAAKRASAKLKAHIETLPVALGENDGRWYQGRTWSKDTHRARLWGIEELKPKVCEHEVYTETTFNGIAVTKTTYRCLRCRKELRPEWKEVE